ILPAMVLLGFGCGMALNPVLLAAMSEVQPSESGLASGVVNTAFMLGGAIGLAVLASLAASRSGVLAEAGMDERLALLGGYQAAFRVGPAFPRRPSSRALPPPNPASAAPAYAAH